MASGPVLRVNALPMVLAAISTITGGLNAMLEICVMAESVPHDLVHWRLLLASSAGEPRTS